VTKKWKKLMTVLALILAVFTIGTSVIADDGHDDDEKHEYYQKSSDDWEAEQPQRTTEQQTDYWNIWSREARNNPNNSLPITEPAVLTAIVGSNETNVYFIPKEGQLLVSADTIAEVLGAQVQFYPQSKIALFSKGNRELIVKASSNVAFENKVKNPMPLQATFYENSIYLPVSVAANALGYRLSWDIGNQVLVFQSI
jgi:hypothetical protein